MRSTTRRGAVLVAGAAVALAACSRRNDAADSTAAATPSTDSTAAVAAPAADSAALGAAGTAGTLGAANVASLVSLTNGSELGAARLAREKGTDADVQAFARTMIADHQAMQRSLDSLVRAKGLTPTPPAQADPQRQQDDQMMAALDGAPKGIPFDKAYADAQVQAHQKALNDLQSFAGGTADADLKALLEAAIPRVHAHLDRAQQLQRKLGGGA